MSTDPYCIGRCCGRALWHLSGRTSALRGQQAAAAAAALKEEQYQHQKHGCVCGDVHRYGLGRPA